MTRPLEIAFVNNMPDAALAATATQFTRLVHAAAADREIRWRCYSLPGGERSESARRYLARGYDTIEALYRRGADALIVTGSEPRAARLVDEPYWPHLAWLVDWARDNTTSAIWSCLSAHAATLHLAGIERRPAARKVSGVYRFESRGSARSILDAGRITVPHSRYNGLCRIELERNGFSIASCSDAVGVDMFWREEPSLFVFLQGHPEYDADTLLKEYRRDVGRFIDGARATYPDQPENFFSDAVAAKLDALQDRIASGLEADPLPALGAILASQHCVASWAANSATLFRNWLASVAERAAAHRRSA